MYVVLVYDISQEKNGAKRWSKVFKISKKYLSHIQNSVFEIVCKFKEVNSDSHNECADCK